MSIKEQMNAILELSKKYNGLPRSGWVDKGSRSKSNHTVEVSREEIKKLAQDCYTALYSEHVFMYEALNLKEYLVQLAKSEHDMAICSKCHDEYRRGWLDGKCPYCEAIAAAESMVK